MKAIRVHAFGGPEVLKFEDVPDPTPGPGQVVVRARAVGINPFEAYMRAGAYGAAPLPFTPGVDAGGVVESAGVDVHVKVGDPVYTAGTVSGAYAELVLCNDAQVHPLPQRVSFSPGACIGVPYGTAYRAIFQRGNAIAGEWVLVNGASGGVGIAATQIARAAGLTVIGTAGTDKGLNLAREQGAHHVLNHNDPDYLDQAKALTGGRGVDLILEMLANVNLGKDLNALATKGRVVVIGSRGTVEIDPRLTVGSELSILGMTLNGATPQELHTIHAALYAGLENGTLRPVVGRELPLAEAAEAHRLILEPGASGKIVMIP